MTDTKSFLESHERYRQALAATTALNKKAVFDALSDAGITSVTLEFDGEGDSGQIESVIACIGETPVALPPTRVTLERAYWHSEKRETQDLPLAEAVEALCYDCLEDKHSGWENNDGAFGTFILDVAARTVELEFNGRFSDTYTHNHTF
jgi:hypothetical protein